VRRRCGEIWLHVRDDNPGALELYRQLGFIEKARCTSWDAQPALTPCRSRSAEDRAAPGPPLAAALVRLTGALNRSTGTYL
jgi:hypothetical protein